MSPEEKAAALERILAQCAKGRWVEVYVLKKGLYEATIGGTGNVSARGASALEAFLALDEALDAGRGDAG